MPADTLSLHGKVAIVTGSGRENGIGAGIALALARNGAAVTVNYVSESSAPRAEKVAESLRKAGGKAIVVQGSVDTIDGAKHLVNETLAKFETDHIDILVNNAGTGTLVDIFSDLDAKGIDQTAKLGHKQTGVYAATKAALENLTWSWAANLGRSKGITVNSVAPGPVPTDILPEEVAAAIRQPEIDMTRAADRAGTQEDIGDAVLLLVNEKARWITGQNIGVNGGVTR